MRLARANKQVEKEGKPETKHLGSSFKKSKRWFDNKYQDAIAIGLQDGNAEFFFTVTGSEKIPELLRLRGVRDEKEMIELTNRLFNIQLKSILHDISNDLLWFS